MRQWGPLAFVVVGTLAGIGALALVALGVVVAVVA